MFIPHGPGDHEKPSAPRTSSTTPTRFSTHRRTAHVTLGISQDRFSTPATDIRQETIQSSSEERQRTRVTAPDGVTVARQSRRLIPALISKAQTRWKRFAIWNQSRPRAKLRPHKAVCTSTRSSTSRHRAGTVGVSHWRLPGPRKMARDRKGRQLSFDDIHHYQKIARRPRRNTPPDGRDRRDHPRLARRVVFL